MTHPEIARQRLYNQNISRQVFTKPAEIVKYMGAVQAQDYAGAKWAVALRLKNCSDAAVEKAMANGSIIRTHVLRPTWHFVAPDDLHWMLDLTAQRIMNAAASLLRQLKLDSAVFKKSNDALAKALEGGKQLSRTELNEALKNAGIATDEQRLIHLLMRAELDKVICSGRRHGKQFGYAFFDDRIPAGNNPGREEALGELVKRYFISHGPATLHDFAWWSGLTLGDAKTGLEIVKNELISIPTTDAVYWTATPAEEINGKAPLAHLLPPFDEFTVAYSNRVPSVNARYTDKASSLVLLGPTIVLNNQVAGTWKRTLKKNSTVIDLNPFGNLNQAQTRAVEKAAERYRKFAAKSLI